MGNLGDDTAIEAVGDDRFRGELCADWNIWGPMGGYLASLGLRAAGEHCGRHRPAVLTGHFVGGATAGPVEIRCTTQRATKVATSVHLTMHQGERIVFTAMVWGVDADLPALEHQVDAPAVRGHDGLVSSDELRAEPATFPFWSNLEFRPLAWIDDWDNRTETDPTYTGWMRFRPGSTFADPWLDACRQLILIDVAGWPAATGAHVGALDVYAPTLEVTARFVGSTADEPWLYLDAVAPVAHDGLVTHEARLWSTDGRLVAAGGSAMMCRSTDRLGPSA